MSPLPPKADMFGVELDVCFVPEADIAQAGLRKRPPFVESVRFANVVIGTSVVWQMPPREPP